MKTSLRRRLTVCLVGMAVGSLLLAVSRTDTKATRPGIYRVTGDFPTSADDKGGCRRTTASSVRRPSRRRSP